MKATMEKPADTLVQEPGTRLHVSAGPHVRGHLTTGKAMLDVIFALLPATAMGVWVHGVHSLLVILTSVATAMLAEFTFDWITKRPNTLKDGSAAVTGLLLALTLPASVPLYIPFIGSLFAIIVVKCLFGGLGKNFVNPALTARCFLLISFSTVMTHYTVDGVTAATPLTKLLDGDTSAILESFLGYSSDVIGGSVAALLLGGFYLWIVGGITYEIPTSMILSFCLFLGVFGEHGFDLRYMLGNLYGGGVVMGALFMANDPVTCPTNSLGHIVYGTLIGVLCAVFRLFGSATDSVSYAILAGNLVVPIIDEYIVPKPYGYKNGAQQGYSAVRRKFPKSAVTLCVVTVIAGLCLSSVYLLTKGPIEEQKMQAQLESYKAVCPGAESFSYDDGANAAIEALAGGTYGSDFGRVKINEAAKGSDGSFAVSVTTSDGFEGDITLAVGIAKDGTVHCISFIEIKETPGKGMLCDEPAFRDQFAGVKTDRFSLSGTDGAAVNGVSGATVSSRAVVNAVNAALDFWAAYCKEGA